MLYLSETKIKNTNDSLWWRECGVRGTLFFPLLVGIETSFFLTLLLDSLVNVLKTMMLNVYWLDEFRA